MRDRIRHVIDILATAFLGLCCIFIIMGIVVISRWI